MPGESHGQSSLVGYSPWGLKVSDITERLYLYLTLSPARETKVNIPGEAEKRCMEKEKAHTTLFRLATELKTAFPSFRVVSKFPLLGLIF